MVTNIKYVAKTPPKHKKYQIAKELLGMQRTYWKQWILTAYSHIKTCSYKCEYLTNYLRQRVAVQIQQHCSCLETCPELKKTVQGQCGHMGFTPPLPSLLYFFLELHPPKGSKNMQRHRIGENTIYLKFHVWGAD